MLQLVAALTFLGYTAAKKDVRLPLVSDAPFELEVVLPDAKGLVPGQGARRSASPARPPGGSTQRARRATGARG